MISTNPKNVYYIVKEKIIRKTKKMKYRTRNSFVGTIIENNRTRWYQTYTMNEGRLHGNLYVHIQCKQWVKTVNCGEYDIDSVGTIKFPKGDKNIPIR